MASNTPPDKRRRLGPSTSSTLSKPFKSPLRKPLQASHTPKPETSFPSPKKEQEKGSGNQKENNSFSTPITLPPPQPTLKTPPSTTTTTQPRKKPLTPTTDPELTTLQKAQRTLQSRLASLRQDLDTVQQAQRIEGSSKTAELEGLISKWKAVAQDAAEEVFASAKERVGRMGGMRARREQMQKGRDASARWEEEEMANWFGDAEVDQDGDEGGDVDGKRQEAKEKIEELREEKKRKREEEEEKGGEDGGREDEVCTGSLAVKTMLIEIGAYYGLHAEDAEYRACDYRL